jgi:hypothetical protein
MSTLSVWPTNYYHVGASYEQFNIGLIQDDNDMRRRPSTITKCLREYVTFKLHAAQQQQL